VLYQLGCGRKLILAREILSCLHQQLLPLVNTFSFCRISVPFHYLFIPNNGKVVKEKKQHKNNAKLAECTHTRLHRETHAHTCKQVNSFAFRLKIYGLMFCTAFIWLLLANIYLTIFCLQWHFAIHLQLRTLQIFFFSLLFLHKFSRRRKLSFIKCSHYAPFSV